MASGRELRRRLVELLDARGLRDEAVRRPFLTVPRVAIRDERISRRFVRPA